MLKAPRKSPVRALLAIPAIGSAGVEHSIVFAHLPASARAKIQAAITENEKIRLASAAGDPLPTIAEMLRHYVTAPRQRQQADEAFPTLASLDDFPLPGVLDASDREWLRLDHGIQSVLIRECKDGWFVQVLYTDGILRTPAPRSAQATRDNALLQQTHILQAAWVLGLL